MHTFLRLLLLTCLLASCAADDGRAAVLAAAKRDSIQFCRESKDGCEYSAVRTKDGWAVHAIHILHSPNGERVYVPGADYYYSYDVHSKLLSDMPGL